MKLLIAAALWVMSLTFFAEASFAEGFLDLYAGPSYTDDATATITSKATTTSRDVSFKNDLTYGVRGGYWFKSRPWLGVAGDFATMHAEGKNAKFDLAPLTALAMFRLPLFPDDNIPQGVVQPYVGVGPSVALYSYASADFGPPTTSINNWNVNAGFQIPAGVAFQLSKHVALFGEYRYAYYRVVVNQDVTTYLVQSAFGNSDNVARRVSASLSTHNALFGISLRF